MLRTASAPFHLSPAIGRALTLSPTLLINERVNDMWARGETVYHLGFGESRFPVHPIIQDALRANVHRKSYLAGQGLAELRQVVAAFYSRHLNMAISPAQIMTGPGSKSIIYALQAALQADLLLPTPCWVSYGPQARLLGKPVYAIPAAADEGFPLTIEALDATVRPTQGENKILLITSPNNPTGQMYGPGFLAQLADYCRSANIAVISDEIYALVAHSHTEHRSLAHYYPEGTIALGGLSKHLSLGGWRLGTAVLPDTEQGRQLMMALRVVAGEIWSTPTGPIQYAGITAYGEDPEISAYIDECSRLHEVRTQYLWGQLTALGIPSERPDGAFYMFPRFDRWREPLARLGVTTSTELAEYLLEQYRIATLPGTAFNVPAETLCLRLASSYLDMETDEQAQAILNAWRADPDPERLLAEDHPATNEALRRFGEFVGSLD